MSSYLRIDLSVVVIANLINIVMAFLFAARISGLPQIQYVLGVAAMFMGFGLGYAAFLNRKNKRDKWLAVLLLPIFLFFIVELFLDYVFVLNFRSTVGAAFMFYYIMLGCGD